MNRSKFVKLDADIQGHYIVALRERIKQCDYRLLRCESAPFSSPHELLKEKARALSLLRKVKKNEVNPEDLIELSEFDD